jgi:hypothetical protein
MRFKIAISKRGSHSTNLVAFTTESLPLWELELLAEAFEDLVGRVLQQGTCWSADKVTEAGILSVAMDCLDYEDAAKKIPAGNATGMRGDATIRVMAYHGDNIVIVIVDVDGMAQDLISAINCAYRRVKVPFEGECDMATPEGMAKLNAILDEDAENSKNHEPR